jgi:hypothetical protein
VAQASVWIQPGQPVDSLGLEGLMAQGNVEKIFEMRSTKRQAKNDLIISRELLVPFLYKKRWCKV